jgi:hypothetical protein
VTCSACTWAVKEDELHDEIGSLIRASGSGTTILAAERVGRRAFALELEPRFVDVALRRWQAVSGRDAIHIASARSFDEIALSSVNSPTTPLALAA